ncbi:MAG TPA: ATP-dependent helicase [Kiritimatiellia bacterium]|nr:ATP-dependent helicase [Kiritimatiellia bacterium]HPS07168.1 ATP-dependent helicase [Kiritimatiellia bacterium]
MAEAMLNILGSTETKPFIDRWWKAYSRPQTKMSPYDALVQAANLHAENDPEKCKRRYERLKVNDYRVEDWEDALAYVKHVAQIHKPRFKAWFEQSRCAFDHPFSLVVWTCGCGLDLVALHDWLKERVMEDGRVFCDRITSITLIDVSVPALDLTGAITEFLFPSIPVRKIHCNLMRPDRVEVVKKGLIPSFPLVRRVHFLFNWLDLLKTREDAESFARDFAEIVPRDQENANETCLAFSPNYSTIETNIAAFQSVAKNSSVADGVVGNKPMSFLVPDENKTYYATMFEIVRRGTGVDQLLRNCDQRPRLKDSPTAPRLLCSITALAEKACSDCVGKGRSKAEATAADWIHLLNLLSGQMPGGNGECFLERFSRVKTVRRKVGDGEIECLMFLPNNIQHKLLVIIKAPLIDPDGLYTIRGDILADLLKSLAERTDSKILQRIWEDFRSVNEGGRRSAFGEWTKTIRVVYWNSRLNFRELVMQYARHTLADLKDGAGYSWSKFPRHNDVDFSPLFVTPTGPDRLPEKASLEKDQLALIDGQRTLRKVRGAPGTGKTTVMLHRVKYLLENQSLPVLVLCKTVSLISHNERKLAASMADGVESERFIFQTCSKFICDNAQPENRCPRLGFAPEAEEVGHGIAACDACQKRWIEQPVLRESGKLGAVLIDEGQLLPPNLVEAVYKATRETNPYREFYMFCDEEQACRDNKQSVQTDSAESPTKKIVVMPDVGFGRFVTLKKNHRTVNREIFDVCRRVQQAMDNDYDVDELKMDGAVEDEPLDFAKLLVRKVPESDAMEVVCALVNKLDGHIAEHKLAKWAITVIVDSLNGVNDFVERMNGVNREVVTTVIPPVVNEDGQIRRSRRRAEKSLKEDFQEYPQKLHATTIDSAQGQSFDMVILVMKERHPDKELLFTGISRAKRLLWVVDATPDGWVETLLSIPVVTPH